MKKIAVIAPSSTAIVEAIGPTPGISFQPPISFIRAVPSMDALPDGHDLCRNMRGASSD
jgi:hypothetical protein